MYSILVAGFILGFAGSLHCVGMCGPLSLAIPTGHLNAVLKTVSLVVYQLGRVATYALLGLLFGFAGKGIYVAGVQQWFSITMGIVIIMMAGFNFVRSRSVHFTFLNKLYLQLAQLMSKIMQTKPGISGFFLLGMANGLLPCGMVYIALATALSFNEVSSAVVFMALFGSGTLPAMMLVAYTRQLFKNGITQKLRTIVPYFVMLTGILLVLRGLNLGIPFISPVLTAAKATTVQCH